VAELCGRPELLKKHAQVGLASLLCFGNCAKVKALNPLKVPCGCFFSCMGF
jgi:hypothetical protein